MHHVLLPLVALLAALTLTACNEGCSDPPLPENHAEEQTAEAPAKPQMLAYAASYVRTDGYHDGETYPKTAVITSRAALDAYIRDNRDRYDFSHKETVYADTTVGFEDAAAAYDDAWFADHTLVLVLTEEGSGSVRHRVDGVSFGAGTVTVFLTRLVPEVGTDDMAEWHILLALDGRPFAADTPVAVSTVNGKMPEPIGVVSGPYRLVLPAELPEGWKAETSETTDGNGAILLYPEEKPDAAVQIAWHRAFGVCGTGLTQETVALPNETEAHVGYYDGSGLWSFVTLAGLPGAGSDGECVAALTYYDGGELTAEEQQTVIDLLGKSTFQRLPA